MNPRFIIICCAMLTFTAYESSGQQLNLPRKSPKASTSYTIGLTQITIHYSSPAVNGRVIWGDVVPYGQVWRAGANETSSIEFNTDVMVEGEELPKGKYAFFLIPGEGDNDWTAIFNKDWDQWGAYGYDAAHDMLKVKVKAEDTDVNQERLNYSIRDEGVDRGYIRIGWAKKRIFIQLQTNAMTESMVKLEDALLHGEADQKWAIYAQGADFLLGAQGDMDKALEWCNQSTSLQDDQSWNWWIKAQVHAKRGEVKEAIESGEKSVATGKANPEDRFYQAVKETMAKTIGDWKSQM